MCNPKDKVWFVIRFFIIEAVRLFHGRVEAFKYLDRPRRESLFFFYQGERGRTDGYFRTCSSFFIVCFLLYP